MEAAKKELIRALLEQNIIPTKSSIEALEQSKSSFEILFNYDEKFKYRGVNDFINYWNSRYKKILNFLQARQELKNIISIGRLFSKEFVSIIGIIRNKIITKNGNIIFEVEDPTSCVKVVFNKSSSDYEMAKDCQVDEVVGISGQYSNKFIYASKLVLPDIPITSEINSAKACIAVLSDLHVGSKLFLEKEFQNFISWLKGDFEYKIDSLNDWSSKITHVFIVGDAVDGVGVYPKQEEELKIKDIYGQYEKLAEFLSQIPKRIKIILTPGNHDAVELSEPQVPLKNEFAKALLKIPNLILLSNPAMVKIEKVKILCYHGYSYDFFGENVNSIKYSGKNISDRTGDIMRYLLQRRHLSPSVEASPKLPLNNDYLVINEVPDVFLSGHIHKSVVSNYKGVLIVTGSCFQAKTKFQEKVGHEPTPCLVPIIDLKTKDVKILDFNKR